MSLKILGGLYEACGKLNVFSSNFEFILKFCIFLSQ